MSCIFTPIPTFAIALVVALTLASVNLIAKYLPKDFQRIFKAVLEARALAPAL